MTIVSNEPFPSQIQKQVDRVLFSTFVLLDRVVIQLFQFKNLRLFVYHATLAPADFQTFPKSCNDLQENSPGWRQRFHILKKNGIVH